MPAPGTLLLVATALIVGGLVIGLAVIVTLLLRISRALGDAEGHLGTVPGQLGPLGPVVERLTSALSRFRARVDSAYMINDG
jgi:hypothetical protein